MALTRKAKIWIVVLCIPILLVLGSVVALKTLFTSDRLKALVIPKIEEASNRTVTVGNIHLSVFPTLAVNIDSLCVSNKKGRGFSPKPFLLLERLVLDVRLAALLKGSIEVPTMTLVHPRFLLEVNEEGETNYSPDKQPAASQDTGKGAVPVSAKGAGFLLSNFRIVDGELEYLDRKENSATRIQGLNEQLRLDMQPSARQVRIESKTTIGSYSYGSLTTPLISNLPLALDQNLLYEKDKDLLTLEPGQAKAGDIPLTVKGSISALSEQFQLHIVIESDKVNIADLLSLAPKEYMKRAEGIRGTGVARVHMDITGTVNDSTKADIAGVISATNATLQYAQLPKPITNVSLVADFIRTRSRKEFHLTKFSANLGDNALGGTMNVSDFDDPSLTMTANASVNLAELKDYYPLESGTQLSGAMKTNVTIAGKVSNPNALKAAGTMDFQGVTVKTPSSTNPVQNLNGSIAFNNQIAESKKLAMTLGKSDLSLAFWLKNYLSLVLGGKGAPKPLANATLTSNHLYTADITSEKTAGGGTGTPAEQSTKGPKGAGVPLPNVDIEVAATIGTLTMEKFELTNVRSTMRISNGIMNIQSLSCNAFDGSIITKGTINLQKPERPAFDLTTDMNGIDVHALLPRFTSFGQRLYGKLTMNQTLKGTLDDTLGLVPQLLNGAGEVRLENGKLTGLKTNQEIARLLKLPDLEEINFKDWTNLFSIAEGRLLIKDLKITALGADYLVNGSQGLDGSLAYSMSLLLSEKTSARVAVPGFAGEALNLFKDPSGRVKLDLSVSGTSDNPSVALDTRPAQQRATDLVKQKASDEAKKLEDQLKQKGGDLLKNLFKKKQ